MPFVKLDCGILNSTLWFERECREVFLTALLMAEPLETTEPMSQIAIHSLDETGWVVPPGWYGFVPAASVGILHRAGVSEEVGFAALAKLGEPEASSRSPEFDGRRLVRVDGGFLVLNYMKYRERDYTSAERSRRYRERVASRRDNTMSHRDITQVEVEADADPKAETRTLVFDEERFSLFWESYPKKQGKKDAQKAWTKLRPSPVLVAEILSALEMQRKSKQWRDGFIPLPAGYLRGERWNDELSRSDFYQARL